MLLFWEEVIVLRVKCIVPEYYDKELEKYVKCGDIVEVKQDRANYLVFKGIAEPIRKEQQNNSKLAASE